MRNIGSIKNCVQLAILITTVGWWFTACGEDTEKDVEKDVIRPAKIFVVGDSGDAAQRQFPGKVRAAQQVDMSFNFAGTLTKLPIKEGDKVKKGQLLARIDARDYRNTVAAERAKLSQSKTSYERHKKLVEDQVTTPAEFDRVQRMYEVQKVAVKIAEKALSDTSLVAPFAGRIAKRYVDNFKEVQAKEPVVSVQDITSLEMLVDLPESIMALVRKRGSATAVAEFPALPGKKFELQTREVALQADPQTQTYQVVLAMPAPEEINIDLAEGKTPYKAVMDSAVSRMRPVSMAAITTVLGMIPLLPDTFFQAMAITIMAGLTFATILTLVVVPVLYTIFYRIPAEK